MRTDLKNRTPVNAAVDNKILAELKEYSKKTGAPVSKLLDRAIKLFLEAAEK